MLNVIGIQNREEILVILNVKDAKDQIYFDPFLSKKDFTQEEIKCERQKKVTPGWGKPHSLLSLQVEQFI